MTLSLIKTEQRPSERRKLPRFPFCFLLFRPEGSKSALEVSDISQTGMQVQSKSESMTYHRGQEIKGEMSWYGDSVEVKAAVAWVHGQRAGLKFLEIEQFKHQLEKFFDISRVVEHLRPAHEQKMGFEIPNNLKIWLKTDGPVELFIWEHNDSEIQSFQVILWDQYLEWEDGKGLSTGRVIGRRNLETPLMQENVYDFEPDSESMNPRKRDRVFLLV